MKYTFIASAVFALAGSAAFAAPISISFVGEGVGLSDDSLGVDFIGQPIREADDTISFVNAGQGADLVFSEEGGNGFLEARSDDFIFFEQSSGDDFPRFSMVGELAFNSDGSLRVFDVDDTIGAETDVNWDRTIGTLYDDEGNGAIPVKDDFGFFGFRFTIFDNFTLQPVNLTNNDDTPGPLGDLINCDNDECIEIGFQPDSFYGYVSVTHGSVIPGSIFVQNSANTSIVVASTTPDMSAVPLPAAGWMLLAGIGGLAAMKRRKQA